MQKAMTFICSFQQRKWTRDLQLTFSNANLCHWHPFVRIYNIFLLLWAMGPSDCVIAIMHCCHIMWKCSARRSQAVCHTQPAPTWHYSHIKMHDISDDFVNGILYIIICTFNHCSRFAARFAKFPSFHVSIIHRYYFIVLDFHSF